MKKSNRNRIVCGSCGWSHVTQPDPNSSSVFCGRCHAWVKPKVKGTRKRS